MIGRRCPWPSRAKQCATRMVPSRIAPWPRWTFFSSHVDAVTFGFQPDVEQALILYAGMGIACDELFSASALKEAVRLILPPVCPELIKRPAAAAAVNCVEGSAVVDFYPHIRVLIDDCLRQGGSLRGKVSVETAGLHWRRGARFCKWRSKKWHGRHITGILFRSSLTNAYRRCATASLAGMKQ